MPKRFRARWWGSFQTGSVLETENPLEEIWSAVDLHGSAGHLGRGFVPPPGQPVAPYVQYAGIRFRQALEFREAAGQATLLTSPLSLYYSFLNLVRACLCMRLDMLDSTGHGLSRLKIGNDILSSSVKLAKGTFTDYLDAVGYPKSLGTEVRLDEVLARIIELRWEYAHIYEGVSLVVPIKVEAYRDGEVILRIPKSVYDLSSKAKDWSSELPSISGCCTLGPDENTLKTTFNVSSMEDVMNFCSLRMETDLLWRPGPEGATWYLVRQTDPTLVLPRPAYYFVALFILGSIVRYEPELMLQATDQNSLTGWLLKRIVQRAERFFPQLILSWLRNENLYVKSAG